MHVVIVGAGASIACYEDIRDKSDLPQLPSMDNFIDVVGLASVFEKYGQQVPNENIEVVYSRLQKEGNNALIKDLEDEIFKYFCSMRLPDNEVTVYDKLICSLDPGCGDMIFSFNWDPLLIQALIRNQKTLNDRAPRIRFLHGNVGFCYCDNCDPMNRMQNIENKPVESLRCPTCGNMVKTQKLLYPVENKDYAETDLLKIDWKEFDESLRRANIVTIFGYSCPKTDAEARRRLEEAFKERNNGPAKPDLYFINTTEEKQLKENWDNLIFANAEGEYTDFFKKMDEHPISHWPHMFSIFWVCGYLLSNPYSGQGILKDSKIIAMRKRYEKTKSLQDYQAYISHIIELDTPHREQFKKR